MLFGRYIIIQCLISQRLNLREFIIDRKLLFSNFLTGMLKKEQQQINNLYIVFAKICII